MISDTSPPSAGAPTELNRRWRRTLVVVFAAAAAGILLFEVSGAASDLVLLWLLALALVAAVVGGLLAPAINVLIGSGDEPPVRESLRARALLITHELLLALTTLSAFGLYLARRWSGWHPPGAPELEGALWILAFLLFSVPLCVVAWVAPDGYLSGKPVGLAAHLRAAVARRSPATAGLALGLLGVVLAASGALVGAIHRPARDWGIALGVAGVLLASLALLEALRRHHAQIRR